MSATLFSVVIMAPAVVRGTVFVYRNGVLVIRGVNVALGWANYFLKKSNK